MLLLLNLFQGFYGVWELEGQIAGLNLVTHDSFVVSRLEEIRSSMPSPQDYRAAKRATSQLMPLPELGLQAVDWGQGQIPLPGQMCGWWPTPFLGPPPEREFYCGPASATTIGLWRRDVHGDAFPGDLDTFDGFNLHMWVLWGATLAGWWRDGFEDYAASLAPPEYFTFEIRRPGTYWQIVSDIDNGWPLGLMGEMTGPPPYEGTKKAHWVAVKEYFWIGGSDYLVIVADTWWAGVCEPTAHQRFMCWNALKAADTLGGPWVIPVRD